MVSIVLVLASIAADPLPKPDFLPVPKFSATEILRYERRCGPGGCVLTPVFAEAKTPAAADPSPSVAPVSVPPREPRGGWYPGKWLRGRR